MVRYNLLHKGIFFFKLMGSVIMKRRMTPVLGINFGPTLACNLQCEMCEWTRLRKGMTPEELFMDFELAKKILQDLKKLKAGDVCYTFGEPTLHPRFLEIVKFAKDLGLRNSLVTNLTTSKALEAAKFLDEIHVSIDGIGEMYEKIRKGAKWEIVYKHLEELSKVHGNIIMNYVVQRTNLKHVEEIFPLIEKLGIKGIAFCPALNSTQEMVDNYGLSLEEVKEFEKKIEEWRKRYKFKIIYSPLLLKPEKFDCYHQYFTAAIMSDGEVYPCCYCRELNHQEKPYGKVTMENSFYKVWKNKIWKNRNVCRGCGIPHLNPFKFRFT